MTAKTPIEAEAEGARTVTVTWRDVDPFDVPAYRNDWPYDAVLAAEQNQDATLLAALLPPRQFEQFRATRPTLLDARDLLDEIARAIGMASAGESPASTS